MCLYKLRAKSGILSVDKGGADMYRENYEMAKARDARLRAEGYNVVNIDDKYPVLKLITVPIVTVGNILLKIVMRLFPRAF